ncbi:MAG: DUF5615 family PIN-like protein [Thermodesulfobacteriota bacterium]
MIDEDLPRSTADLLRRYWHTGVLLREIGRRGAKDAEIAAYALDHNLCILTGDFDFADIRKYPPSKYKGLVVLKIPATSTGPYILLLLIPNGRRGRSQEE